MQVNTKLLEKCCRSSFCKLIAHQVSHRIPSWKIRTKFNTVADTFTTPCFNSLSYYTSRRNSITVTSHWAPWLLKSPAFHPFVQAYIKNTKAPRHWFLGGESPCNRCVPLTQRAITAGNVPIWWRHHAKLGDIDSKFSYHTEIWQTYQ